MKILLSKLRSMGDVIIMSAALDKTRALFPNAQIDLLLPSQWAPLYEHDPRVTNIIRVDTASKGILKGLQILKASQTLSSTRYDLMMAFHAGKTAKMISYLSFPKKLVLHNHSFFKSDWPSHYEIPNKNILRPAIERDLLCFKPLGLGDSQKYSTKLYLDSEELQWARDDIAARVLKGPLLVMALGASRQTKCWPVERFAEVATQWVESKKGSVLVFTGPGEEFLGQSFMEMSKGFSEIQLVHAPELRVMMALLSQGSLFIGNDSGPKHMAVALGVPTITLFGPEDPYEYHPYDLKKHPILYIQNLSCRKNTDPQGKHPWCGIAECVEYKHQCMQDLRVVDVFETIAQL